MFFIYKSTKVHIILPITGGESEALILKVIWPRSHNEPMAVTGMESRSPVFMGSAVCIKQQEHNQALHYVTLFTFIHNGKTVMHVPLHIICPHVSKPAWNFTNKALTILKVSYRLWSWEIGLHATYEFCLIL